MKITRQHSANIFVLFCLALTGCQGSEAAPSDSVSDNEDVEGIEPSVCDASDSRAEGVCVNDNDCDVIDTKGESVPSQARDSAANCFFQDQCSSNDDIETCVSECMQEDIAISEACSECYAASVKCTSTNCLAKCFKPTAAECVSCQRENGCIDDFFECSGLPSAD